MSSEVHAKTTFGTRIGRFDTLRICLQSLVASALSFACLSFVGSPNLTWGVFSSLFTLQVHFDRSLKSGIGQIIGAVAGTVAGLAALHILPASDEALARLAVTTLVTCLTSAMFPTTNYSIVVAAAIALEPSGTLGALSRAAAIVVGSVIAIAVSISVWPQLARSRAFHVMAELLDDCRALLHALPVVDSASDRQIVDALHERFLRHLVEARAVSNETHVRARFRTGPTLNAALTTLETLWHGLVLLDRVGQARCTLPPGDTRTTLMQHVEAVRECASGYLAQLAVYMRNGAYPHSHEALKPLREASAGARAQLTVALERCNGDHEQMQALSMLGFALEQIEVNLTNIATVLESQF